MNIKRYLIAILIPAALTFSLTFCGSKDGEVNTEPESGEITETTRAEFTEKYGNTVASRAFKLDGENKWALSSDGDFTINNVLIVDYENDPLAKELYGFLDQELTDTLARSDKDLAAIGAELKASDEWLAKRSKQGYFTIEERAEYKTYDNEVLDKLGEEGDVKALMVLAGKIDGLRIRNKVLFRAARLGATHALIELGRSAAPNSVMVDDEDKQRMLVESLAFFNLAHQQGDEGAVKYIDKYEGEVNNIDWGAINNLSNRYWEAIQLPAQ